MRAERSDRPGEIVLGPYEVATDASAISAFAAATGAPAETIPATFPIVWLSGPELKAALRTAAGANFLPVHESQAFDYVRPLAAGARYTLTAVARRESGPERLVVEAAVVELSGAPALTMRAVLRLVPLAEGEGA